MTDPLQLTDIQDTPLGLRRLIHGYSTAGSWRALVQRVTTVGTEVTSALALDAVDRLRPAPSRIRQVREGQSIPAAAGKVALYVHFSPTGTISRMVTTQLDLLRQAGFAVVFITMAAHVRDDDWQDLTRICALAYWRENYGRDFGAWQDILPQVVRRWPDIDELLLVNDSVLGPIQPFQAIIDTLRSGGDGMFGLTESLQGGAHLQSYMLLVKGRTVTEDAIRFIRAMRVSRSKWLLVRRGEIGLSRWMLRRGHRVAALYGYRRLLEAVLADPVERDRVSVMQRRLRTLQQIPKSRAMDLLIVRPLNPTHHLWHLLAGKFGFPFLKTELVLTNPGRIPGVDEWPALVPADAPCPVAVLQDHLRIMRPVGKAA